MKKIFLNIAIILALGFHYKTHALGIDAIGNNKDIKAMESPFDFSALHESAMNQTSAPSFLTVSDNSTLAYYPFVAESSKAILLFYHGGGMWSTGLYQSMARTLAETHAFTTYLFDIRGHGNSQGPRGDAPTPERVWQDIDEAIVLIKKNHPGVPIFLTGHSSGAGLILNYTSYAKDSSSIAGYLFLAPFLGPDALSNKKHTDPERRFIKHARTWVFIVNILTGGRLCRHTPAIYFNYPEWLQQKDPHTLSYYTCAMALATSPMNASAIFKALDKPCAIFIGDKDEQFLPQETIAYSQYALGVKDKSIAEIIPNQTHLSIINAAPAYLAKAIQAMKLNNEKV